jgi:TRAP-type mannitol/chloroaromatic compound transport system permease large subunit
MSSLNPSLRACHLVPYGIILFILGIIFLLGFFLDWIEITLIVLPLLAPVISALGLDINGYGVVDNPELVWFVMLVAMALQTSFLTPPVGFALFYLKGVCPPGVKLTDIYKGVVPFIILQLIGMFTLLDVATDFLVAAGCGLRHGGLITSGVRPQHPMHSRCSRGTLV